MAARFTSCGSPADWKCSAWAAVEVESRSAWDSYPMSSEQQESLGLLRRLASSWWSNLAVRFGTALAPRLLTSCESCCSGYWSFSLAWKGAGAGACHCEVSTENGCRAPDWSLLLPKPCWGKVGGAWSWSSWAWLCGSAGLQAATGSAASSAVQLAKSIGSKGIARSVGGGGGGGEAFLSSEATYERFEWKSGEGRCAV